ncbi:MAG: VCBS repeat-containing protein [Nitrospirae bacterium]|nr:VCBS repeat-containing protein [Nitrospirota bacterium]
MSNISSGLRLAAFLIFFYLPLIFSGNACADYLTKLDHGRYLQDASGDIVTGLWSVPVVYDWNGDGNKDLLIGQSNSNNGYVSYYENTGTDDEPFFSAPSYIQACSPSCAPLNVPGLVGQGSYPSVVDWNNDGKQDLLVGDGDGYVHIFINTGSSTSPVLDGGSLVMASGLPLMVTARATPVMEDWNGDGLNDLLIGDMDGFIYVYLNVGTSSAPVFQSTYFTDSTYRLKVSGVDFDIGSRSAPRVFDWNNDGKKDLLAGEYEGYVYFLENAGTNAAPVFNSARKLSWADGQTLRYPDSPSGAAHSRLYAADWNNDRKQDLIVGGKDGRLILFSPKVVHYNFSGESGGKCFIATAAYGSYMADDVKILRKFRDRYLITNSIGRKMVNIYYKYSPPIAAYISRHEALRTAVRFSLKPVVFAIKYPQIFLPGIIGIPAILLMNRRKQEKQG